MKRLIIILVCFCLQANFSLAQNTVGLIEYSQENYNGYILFSPMTSKNTYLIDKCGQKVHEWNLSAYRPALSSFLLEDGSLLRTCKLNNPNFNEGGSGGRIEKFDWEGNLTWSYNLSDAFNCLHHDIKPLPNGNIICIVWDSYSKDEAILNGKDPLYEQEVLWSEKIVELQPVGTDEATIVWEWKLFDHLIQDFDITKVNYGVVSDHPELVDINYFPGAQDSPDWIHLNSIDYNETLDQILLSSHRLCEVWIIDHSTTTEQAATHSGGQSGKGGDLIYRWGNPQAYKRGTSTNKIFYGQHHATWIPEGYPNEGKIMVFNNGLGRLGDYSSIDIIIPPLDESTGTYQDPLASSYLPNGLDWSYIANVPSEFYSSNISGVYQLDNGSFLITEGATGRFFEINTFQEKLWEYVNPIYSGGIANQGDIITANPVFRSNFYKEDYAAFIGKTLTPSGPIELNPSEPSLCESLSISTNTFNALEIYPNPFLDKITLKVLGEEEMKFELFNSLGQKVLETLFTSYIEMSTINFEDGIYYYKVSNEEEARNGMLLKQ